MPQLFRSRAARYLLAVMGVAAGLVFVFGPHSKWQATPSLLLLRKVPLVPLDGWGWFAVIYGLLLLTPKSKTLGYAFGAFLFWVIAISLIYTMPQTGPKNVFATEGVVIAMVYHLLGVRFSVADRFIP